MARGTDIAIVGGGVIGLACAWRLAQHGARVTVFEAGHTGQSSWAAAGMLAPLAEARSHSPFVAMGLDSLRRYPSFIEELSSKTGQPLHLLGPGMLRVARTEAEEHALCQSLAWQQSYGLPLHWLDRDAVRECEPELSLAIQAAVCSPAEQHIPPRRLLAALRTACEKNGVHFITANVTGVRTPNCAVLTNTEAYPCQQVVISSGAWAAALCVSLGYTLPLRPIRGQALLLGPLASPTVRHTIYGTAGYLVPRPDGFIYAGATEEEAGFDVEATTEGQSVMRDMSSNLVPSLASVPEFEHWAGLRPVMADGLPVIGKVPGYANITIAAGHGRNGILLTPYTADLVTESVLHNIPSPAVLSPSRFGVAQ